MHGGNDPRTSRVAIIGGGFSGAVAALQLAHKADFPVSIEIFEPRETLGGGVAYSATDPAHRINVPALRMIVFRDDPTHFDRWLRHSGALADDPSAAWSETHAFPQRAVFGRYIASLVKEAAAANAHVTIRHRRDQVIGVVLQDEGGYVLDLASGVRASADLVVVATSHPPPAVPDIVRKALGENTDIISNPWQPDALDALDPEAAVLIIGTALTMGDVVASLDRRGHRGPVIAFSRRGLLSRGHPAQPCLPIDCYAAVSPPRTALALLSHVRHSVREAVGDGLPWQAVFDDVRANGTRLWGALPEIERKRLLRHLRTFWDVHRYRIAPQVETVIHRKLQDGSLEVLAASLVSAERQREGRIEIALHPRRTVPEARIIRMVDAIVVTTGPAHAGAIEGNPALRSLAEHGLVQADALHLGLLVDGSSRAIGRNGVANETLFVVGPLARATFGELMGLPQVSYHAEDVADHVASWLRTRHAAAAPRNAAKAFVP